MSELITVDRVLNENSSNHVSIEKMTINNHNIYLIGEWYGGCVCGYGLSCENASRNAIKIKVRDLEGNLVLTKEGKAYIRFKNLSNINVDDNKVMNDFVLKVYKDNYNPTGDNN